MSLDTVDISSTDNQGSRVSAPCTIADQASQDDNQKMVQRPIAESLASLRRRWDRFFWTRCLAGLPWFWPARPAGNHAMVEARRLVRWNFGRDHHPVSRKLAQVLVTLGLAISRIPKLVAGAAMVRAAGRIAEASSRGTLGRDPPQHFAERVLRI